MQLTRTTRFALTPFMLTPVVSLVFLLLLFFVLSSTVVTQSGVQVEMASSPYTLGLQPDPLVVSISAPPQHRVYFNDQPMDRTGLRAALDRIPDRDRKVLIKADRRVDQETLLGVAQVALEAGFSVGIATAATPTPAADPAAAP